MDMDKQQFNAWREHYHNAKKGYKGLKKQSGGFILLFTFTFIVASVAMTWGLLELPKLTNDTQRIGYLIVAVADLMCVGLSVVLFSIWQVFKNTHCIRYSNLILLAREGDREAIETLKEITGEDYGVE